MIDFGTDGQIAPATVDGLPYPVWISLVRRLETEYGRQVMHPTFGLDYASLVDRQVEPDLIDALRAALVDLNSEDLEVRLITVTVRGFGEVQVALGANLRD